MRKNYQKDPSNKEKEPNAFKDSLNRIFSQSPPSLPLDMDFQIILSPSEANFGGKKEISFKVGNEFERLRVSIPSGIRTGQKLRIKDKGYRKNGKRGDLIL